MAEVDPAGDIVPATQFWNEGDPAGQNVLTGQVVDPEVPPVQ